MAVQALHGFSSRSQVLEADQGVGLPREHLHAVQGAKLAENGLQGALVGAGGDVTQQQVPAGLRRCRGTGKTERLAGVAKLTTTKTQFLH